MCVYIILHYIIRSPVLFAFQIGIQEFRRISKSCASVILYLMSRSYNYVWNIFVFEYWCICSRPLKLISASLNTDDTADLIFIKGSMNKSFVFNFASSMSVRLNNNVILPFIFKCLHIQRSTNVRELLNIQRTKSTSWSEFLRSVLARILPFNWPFCTPTTLLTIRHFPKGDTIYYQFLECKSNFGKYIVSHCFKIQ